MSAFEDMFSPGAPAPASALASNAREDSAPQSALTQADPSPLQAPAAPAKRKRRLSFKRLANYVADKTGNFELVLDAMVGIIENCPDARDRIKAAEFLRNWTDANPATVRHVVSGPGGKPIAHLHGHVHKQTLELPDLSIFTPAELDAYVKLTQKALGAPTVPAALPPHVIDVETE